jgi:hypothetical protein
MQITRGKIKRAQKVVIYGPEGIGKSTFASHFPETLFIDTEGSTSNMDVARTPKATSWTMLRQQIDEIKIDKLCKTLVIDTIDWAEQMCVEHILAKHQKSGIEDFGYGNGYVYVKEEFGRFLNQLQEVIDSGINVVLTAHAQMRKFEQPDEMGAYDRYELKLGKKTSSQTSPLVKEWADALLFCNYKTYSVAVDDKGKKHKAQGGKRVMYTSHHPCWDAKNRWELPEEVPFDYSVITEFIPSGIGTSSTQTNTTVSQQTEGKKTAEQAASKELRGNTVKQSEQVKTSSALSTEDTKTNKESDVSNNLSNIPKALLDLMKSKNVTVDEIQKAVAMRGYYPEDTPIENYDSNFVSGVLIGAWDAVFNMINDNRIKSGQFVPVEDAREEIPFDEEMPFN